MQTWLKLLTSFLLVMSHAPAAPTAPTQPNGYQWDLPAWVPPPLTPADNPMSDAKVELGRHLFYDKRLSADHTMACATCHLQEKAFTDGRALSNGIDGHPGGRSAMSLVNVAYFPVLTWMNPNLTSLEVQALIPIFGDHPIEMGMAGQEKKLFQELKQDPTYKKLFTKAFPEEAEKGEEKLFSLSTLTKAIASFERSLLSFNSPYDQYKYGKKNTAISDAAKRGESLFFGEKMECYHCHGGLNFNDNVQHIRMPFPEFGFHNTGLYNTDGKGAYQTGNPGIIDITGDERDAGKFRTPSLRNIALTAPYMHDGSIKNLRDVLVQHYAHAGRSTQERGYPNPQRSELLQGFDIDEEEVSDLIEFLKSLTDQIFTTNPKHSNPWTP